MAMIFPVLAARRAAVTVEVIGRWCSVSREVVFTEELAALWKEMLGDEADLNTGFIANGGDSLQAVLFADRVFRLTGRELDYLEILEAPDVAALAASVLAGDRE
ncbi:phosphopantetheine-binding protein [Streptomyces griseoluteus]|jgi:aryl carrier-like protein|uniref:phosphopantetheine-binding protein n=1 Tax=Streptomyces TaxID=1883 RepID=UPI000A36E1BA|nr:phosphopantetheine-binding protein [Streptomyces recifensis]